jgi:tRNA nucleotidyltransferase (CCA-adding enzyme)
MWGLLAEIKTKNLCCTIKDLDITGDDLIEIGYEEGESIGKVLKLLLDEVLKMPFANKRNWLVNWAEKHLEELKGKENAVQHCEDN